MTERNGKWLKQAEEKSTGEIFSDMARVATIAYQAYKVTTALSKDLENNTTNEAVDAVTTSIGVCAGGALGAKVGDYIWPGVGAFVGRMVGEYYGPAGAKYVKEQIEEQEVNVNREFNSGSIRKF